MEKRFISIIIPLYNEEENIPVLYERVRQSTDKISHDFELLFVDDGSTDKSIYELEKISIKDKKVKIIEFSRNFGKEMAMTAGLNRSSGDACILLDGDLQHPPEIIQEFIKKWEEGGEVVIGIRKTTKSSLGKKFSSYLSYKILNKISDTKIYPNSTDFRLLDRMVVDEFNKLTENHRITRGLINWLGFKQEFVYFDAPKRAGGKSGYGFFKRLHLASDAIVNLSLFPLKLAGYFGIFISLSSAMIAAFVIVEKYILKDPWNLNFTGVAVLGFVNLVLVGVILICLGLIALYIANIHNETLDRPLYIIRKKQGKE